MTCIVYVPFCASVNVSKKYGVPKHPADVRTEWSGLKIDTVIPLWVMPHPGYDPFVRFSATRSAAVPENVRFAYCPTMVVVTVTGGPPFTAAVIVVLTSATLNNWNVMLPE